MPDRLSIYNGALRFCGERKLANLSENYESRYLLDDAWDNDFIDTILEQGQWDFATRTVKLDYAPSIEPEFGYRYAYNKPEDWIRTVGLSADEYFTAPLLEYTHESGFWFTDQEELYLRFVSNDPEFGGDLSLWTPNFARYAEGYLGLQIADSLMQSAASIERLEGRLEKLLLKAKNTDAMESPATFPPRGSWTLSRRGGRSGIERGSRNKLIG